MTENSLNLSAKIGPSGKRVLSLKAFAKPAAPPVQSVDRGQQTPPADHQSPSLSEMFAQAVASKDQTANAPVDGDAERKAQRIARSDRDHAIKQFLRKQYPRLFNPVIIRPLAIGIGVAIVQSAIDAGFEQQHVNRIVRIRVNSLGYQQALGAYMSQRWGLDGEPVCFVSDGDRNAARQWVSARHAQYKPKAVIAKAIAEPRWASAE